jgi:NAD(P)-dependent dehydrogenase (short-subunit alcohol dehydrogenase family)
VITGGDSGIGRAVAIAYAREGADVLISYLSEHKDAEETMRWVEQAGRKAVLVPGDIQSPQHCRSIIDRAVKDLGGIDILVNNAAHQASFKTIDEIADEEWELTFRVNIHAMFYLSKAAVPHMKPGSAIINTASINADVPNPTLLAYATTKGAIQNFTAGLAQMLAEKAIRANCVAPGLDPFNPCDHGRKGCLEFREKLSDEASSTTCRACHDLRDASGSTFKLHIWRDRSRHRRQAAPVRVTREAIVSVAVGQRPLKFRKMFWLWVWTTLHERGWFALALSSHRVHGGSKLIVPHSGCTHYRQMFLKRPEMRIKPSSAAITRATRAGQLIEAATRARGGRSARTRLRIDQLAFVLLQRQPSEMRLVDLVRGASLNEPRLPLAGRPCFLSVSNHGNPGLHLRPAKSLRRLAPNRIARSPPNTRRP